MWVDEWMVGDRAGGEGGDEWGFEGSLSATPSLPVPTPHYNPLMIRLRRSLVTIQPLDNVIEAVSHHHSLTLRRFRRNLSR